MNRPGKEPPPARRAPVACLVSLGCSKNTVDSERILAALVQDGFLVAERPGDADVCLVNTCGFIVDAREETAAALADLAAQRARGAPRVLVALGCLVERAAEVPELAAFLRDADARIGFADYLRLPERCRALLASAPAEAARTPAGGELPAGFHRLPRLVTGGGHSVPLKISEGCSHACRFCTIPRIRGRQVSRPAAEIVAEARSLVEGGAVELCLIAQDTTSYGLDRGGRRLLPELLRAVAAESGARWIRLMYAHPRHLDDALLDVLASDGRFCPYLDLPLQHATDRMLGLMGRGMDAAATRAVLARVRARWPAAALRSAFIVGHPGETEADFAALRDFVAEGRFLHAGVFAYSPEAGTPSAALEGAVPPEVVAERRGELMRAQRDVSRRRLAEWVGREVDVLVDGPAPRESGLPAGVRAAGRIREQAPEVDGATWLAGRVSRGLRPGTFVRARVGAALDYDLVAEPRAAGSLPA